MADPNDKASAREASQEREFQSYRAGRRDDGASDDEAGLPGILVADRVLTKRHDALESALHGGSSSGPRRPIYWDGTDQAGFTLESIRDAIDTAVPPDRPTEDYEEYSLERIEKELGNVREAGQ